MECTTLLAQSQYLQMQKIHVWQVNMYCTQMTSATMICARKRCAYYNLVLLIKYHTPCNLTVSLGLIPSGPWPTQVSVVGNLQIIRKAVLNMGSSC
jgi:hypothetical protein